MQPIIQTKNLCKSFGDAPVLSDVNLDIFAGEIFGVIGRSGAGKSTLARCFNLLERPTSGEIFFGGTELTSLKPAELYKARQSMGMIFQQFNLLMQRNVLDNVCFPLEIAGVKRADARKRAAELLDVVGLADKAKAYPAKLSGGQKQRVAIARAIAPNPKVLLCDEATSALDPETTDEILELLADINKRFGITIVIITHEMRVIETLCTRVAVISGNKLTVEEVARNG
jgi:D-methionine transport system ATP-binding protein